MFVGHNHELYAPLLHAPRVEVLVTRRAEKKVLSRAEREGLKARDIMARYPADKGKALIKSLKDRGLWYYDDEFPQDEEDRSLGFDIMTIIIPMCITIIIDRYDHYRYHSNH